jgi:hypothetical protein
MSLNARWFRLMKEGKVHWQQGMVLNTGYVMVDESHTSCLVNTSKGFDAYYEHEAVYENDAPDWESVPSLACLLDQYRTRMLERGTVGFRDASLERTPEGAWQVMVVGDAWSIRYSGETRAEAILSALEALPTEE